ncbi:Uncharacterized protein APZ42_013292 [Daphnia magna]|uniref:Uncharacterized protein n=1 Tax=Daphnia magna TaxID=35525 RepID=A0A162R0S1_9CRUS|nr:Uncharacterized protein APZ42_013292 [Daphnia magna]
MFFPEIQTTISSNGWCNTVWQFAGHKQKVSGGGASARLWRLKWRWIVLLCK